MSEDLKQGSREIHSEDQKGEHQHSGRPHPPVEKVKDVVEDKKAHEQARAAIHLRTGRNADGSSKYEE
jgi:hypothetical protein